jgi:outer membrane protein insertion porin family
VGGLWGVRQPSLLNIDPNSTLAQNQCTADVGGAVSFVYPGQACPTGSTLTRGALAPFRELFLGDSPSPRLSIGVGVNWNSPFGPFRIDIARALLSEPGDDTKLFTFNVGTAF